MQPAQYLSLLTNHLFLLAFGEVATGATGLDENVVARLLIKCLLCYRAGHLSLEENSGNIITAGLTRSALATAIHPKRPTPDFRT